MPSFNRVTLVGNLTRDPESKTLPSGTIVSEFGLAINRHYRTQGGEEREEVCFVDCAAFGRQAEVIQEYCVKGRPLLVEGRLRYDQWDDKQGGKRSKLSVVVETFQFLGGGRENDGDDRRSHERRDARPQPQHRSESPSRGEDGASRRPSADARAPHTDRDERSAGPPARKGRGSMNTGVGRQKKFTDADIPF